MKGSWKGAGGREERRAGDKNIKEGVRWKVKEQGEGEGILRIATQSS